MELREYWAIIRRRWISILVCTLLGVGIAAAFNATATRQYTATAQNFVALTSANGDQDPLTGAQFASQRVKSYTEVVTSPDVLNPVIQELGLPYDANQLAKQVSVTNPAQTVLLVVNAVDTSPALAAAIANSVSKNLGKTIQQLETPSGKTKNSPVKVTLIEPATTPIAPSSPRVTLNLALGLLLGVAVGLGQAFLRHSMDRTVKSATQLAELTDSPVLGLVNYYKDSPKNPLTALDARSAISEGYRTIRANLKFVGIYKPLKSIVITSAAPSDGKTTVSCNLAVSLAQSGKKVCLVEADLRRPKVATYMGVDGSVGLTNVLARQTELDDVLISWNRGMLSILGPGTLPPNPSELLGSLQFNQLLSQLESRFDIVVIDSPPLLAVADANLLGVQADGVILVTRFGKTMRDAVHNATSMLSQGDKTLLGTVLNAIPSKYGYYYGEYAYDYEYSEPLNKAKSDQGSSQGARAETAVTPVAGGVENSLAQLGITGEETKG